MKFKSHPINAIAKLVCGLQEQSVTLCKDITKTNDNLQRELGKATLFHYLRSCTSNRFLWYQELKQFSFE